MTTTTLIPASMVRARFGGISAMTEWRWRRKGILPAPAKINGRNYYSDAAINHILDQLRARGAGDPVGGAE